MQSFYPSIEELLAACHLGNVRHAYAGFTKLSCRAARADDLESKPCKSVREFDNFGFVGNRYDGMPPNQAPPPGVAVGGGPSPGSPIFAGTSGGLTVIRTLRDEVRP